ncbi:MAG: TIGR00645 family protein [Hyphomicrobiales bacterium]|nr:TIGR00645 family protein [Hyphomicrobiales bacterium]
MREAGEGPVKALFERLLLASRWLLTPFYVALILALLELLAKVAERVYQVATQFLDLTEEGVLLSALSVVDLTLSASLIVIVMLSGYANFVSRFDVEGHTEWPRWIAEIDFSSLKVKLMASIVAISAVKLLEAFMETEHESDRDLGWQTGILMVFVVSALLVAIADRLGDRHNGGES